MQSEIAEVPHDPKELLREQVFLLRQVRQSLEEIKEFQQKSNEELSLMTTAYQTRSERSRVKISNIDIPIGSLIVFMLKWAVAGVPVLLIVAAVLAGLGWLGWYIFK